MELGIIRQVDIDQQMQEAYLDYAMSVIVSRALPDVRDGLKPVHRRILYAMYDMGLRSDRPYKKSARIVGEVLGKYHPHGDAAVYDAMVRMAQDFSMRAILVDGQGNFGSQDGDPPAAMRYTEARLTTLAEEFMTDLDKDTVDFMENFDGSLVEPSVLPAKVPNFLVNGAAGIAVAMATSVPPHNLNEVCDALIFMIDQQIKKKEVELDDLLNFIEGPDFPTGGIIYRYPKKSASGDEDQIKAAYARGRGRVTVQARVHIEEMSRNRHRLVITELPYQTNKANLVEKIADLARDGKIEGLTDLRDESDRQGMRLVIEMSRTVKPRSILKKLFKMTPLQATFSISMLGLVDGEPRLLPLKRALILFLEHRQEIITRRSQYELEQAKQRAHILEGLRLALANLDEVIETIRRSRSVETARNNLRRNFNLTVSQATAILDMPLRRLASLERKKIEKEYKEVGKQITRLEGLLRTPQKILQVIREDLIEIKETHGSPRRTQIIDRAYDRNKPITSADLAPDEEVVVAVSEAEYLCRWPVEEKLNPGRGRQKDPLLVAAAANTRDTLCLLSADGQALLIPMHQVPVGAGPGTGLPLTEFSRKLSQPIVTALSLVEEEENGHRYLFLVSRSGRVKRVSFEDLQAIRSSQSVVMGLDDDDSLLTGFTTGGEGEVVLITAQGQAIRFAEEDVRAMGLAAGGVLGIKLADEADSVVGAGPIKPRCDILVVTEQGLGKRTDMEEYPTQGRYGQGVITIKIDKESGPVAVGATINVSDRVMMVSRRGNKTVYGRSIVKMSRNQYGQSLISIKGTNRLERLIILPG